jgi:hypothetical protein
MLPAGIGQMAGCRLVAMSVGSRDRVGLAIYRLYLEAHFTYNRGSGFLSVGGRWSESEII